MAKSRQTFLIIGLGLLGGSLALAIRKKFPNARILGVSRESKKIALARKKRFIHDGSTKLSQMVPHADFILICSPVDTIPKLIFEIERFAKRGTIVTDVGSTKKEIVKLIERKSFRNIYFVGSHPLAGSHLTGLAHSKVNLFEQAFVFVTPTSRTNRRAVSNVSSFWKKLNASVHILSPEKHDQIVSQISHAPHAIASVLINSVNSNAIRFAGSGFRDTTRIAAGDPRLWAPIFISNRKNLVRNLKEFQRALNQLLTMLNRKSKSRLYRFLTVASSRRVKT